MHARLLLLLACARSESARRQWPWWWTLGGGWRLWRTHANGTLVIHPRVRRLLVDVGAHRETQFLEHARQSEDTMVIAFEPLVGYAPGDTWWPKAQDKARVLLVPAAIGNDDTWQWPTSGKVDSGARPRPQRLLHAYTNENSGLSSMLPLSDAMTRSGNFSSAEVMVEILSLEEVLDRVPMHVEIPLVKVDVQGFDLVAVLSAGEQLRRLARIQVECQDLPAGHQNLLYVGQPTKQDFIDILGAKGFELERCWENTPRFNEENCIFARRDLRLDVRQGCFEKFIDGPIGSKAKTTLLSELAGDQGTRSPIITRYNIEKATEFWCCRTRETSDYTTSECFEDRSSRLERVSTGAKRTSRR
eukprot:gnl/TRDRNA2_/TRDRNA2_167183_c0_seq2.p1 gnl/TRDRNA2_/TRDRNA2_167183_c0~~gnl/TRDRNA2_/TRDRNA2_167183_c0_seq2.p1  ORF type:complete len:359 (-),score=44.60 gnl/TRDRNA2_/TRDRNA2_167183_c0_seq2:56-1132(-)